MVKGYNHREKYYTVSIKTEGTTIFNNIEEIRLQELNSAKVHLCILEKTNYREKQHTVGKELRLVVTLPSKE